MFIEHLLCAHFCSRCYMYNISGNAHYNPMRLLVTIIIQFTFGNMKHKEVKLVIQGHVLSKSS